MASQCSFKSFSYPLPKEYFNWRSDWVYVQKILIGNDYSYIVAIEVWRLYWGKTYNGIERSKWLQRIYSNGPGKARFYSCSYNQSFSLSNLFTISIYLDTQNIHIFYNFSLIWQWDFAIQQEKLFKMGSILSSKDPYSS